MHVYNHDNVLGLQITVRYLCQGPGAYLRGGALGHGLPLMSLKFYFRFTTWPEKSLQTMINFPKKRGLAHPSNNL